LTSFAAGSRLGHYEIISPLGAGGMGEVYRALDGRLKRQVAVKILPSVLATSDGIARFEREAELLASSPEHRSDLWGCRRRVAR
jgi:serine/threonine protein kinase